MSDTRISTFSLPSSVVDQIVALAQDTNVSIHTIVTAALEQFLNRADRQADIETARRAYLDAHARYAVDGHNDAARTAYLHARQTLLDLLDTTND